MEPVVHGRGRKTETLDETYFGVHEKLLYARKIKPVEGTSVCNIKDNLRCFFFGFYDTSTACFKMHCIVSFW